MSHKVDKVVRVCVGSKEVKMRSKCQRYADSSDVPDGRGQAHGSINVPVARNKQVGRCECGEELAVLAG